MRIIEFSPQMMQPITQFQSTGAASTLLAVGAGETRVHGVRFEPAGQMGSHPTGSAQLFLIVRGDGWVMGGDGRRVNVATGQGAFFERGEQHAKGSDRGMVALMVQVDTLDCCGPELCPAPDDRPALRLQTPRLFLRPFTPSDATVFALYRSDPEVARYQGWDTPFDVAQAQAFIAGLEQVVPGTPGAWYQLAICLRDTGDQIGDCAFRVLADDPRQGEVGFTLARPYQGHGYATEAVGGLLGHLFGVFQLHRVHAICDVENPASARVLERLGFRREGECLENAWFKGHWSSEYLYAILGREWSSRVDRCPRNPPAG
jgi:RimJ/RimL family protein N-acetyltransferase